jgi:hypothetical protein
VHSEASLEEICAAIRQAFGLKETTKCSIKRDKRTGPYAPSERIEVIMKKRKRNAGTTSTLIVQWGDQTKEVTLPNKMMAKGLVEECIRAQWPELTEIIHEYDYQGHKGNY